LNEPAADPGLGFRIGEWHVRPTAGELVGLTGEIRHLEPQVMDVLVELARAWPEVLERNEAIRVVWGGRPVADDGLARCIALLRKALGDSRAEPTYIQTVPKRGYRLLAAVEAATSSSGTGQSQDVGIDDTVEDWTGPVEFDNLRILRLLGRGTMGVVHLAQETNLERLVAVKTLRGVVAGDDRAERRFLREAAAAARINHPNVTRVFRLGDLPDGSPYIVMQYIRGRTLNSLMASSGELGEEAAVSIIRQIATGLEAAHRERVIHRDVKPSNVLIEHDTDLAILSDFGIAGIQETGARIATRLTQHGEVLGDVRYISPEQVQGDPPTPASDIYSLGILAYELLSGTYPYRETASGLLAHLEQEPQPLSTRRPDVDAGLQRIVMQALAKNADDRPTAAQFLAALDDDGTSQTTGAGNRGSFLTSRPVLWTAIVVAAVLAALAVYVRMT